MIYFLITLGLQLIGFLFDQIITHRLIQRLRTQYNDISSLSHLDLQIDDPEWKRMVSDFVNRTAFERLEATYGFISENGILLSGVFSWILSISNTLCESVIRQYFVSTFVIDNMEIWKGVTFLFLVSLFSAICKAPFEVFRVFVIQNSNGSFTKWLIAQLKMGFLAVIIGSPLLSLILWLITIGGGEQWTYIWVGAGALSVGIYELYPSVLLPLFSNVSFSASAARTTTGQDGTDCRYFNREIWNPFFKKLGIEPDMWEVTIIEHDDIANAFTVERSGVLWIVVYSPLLELSLEEVQAVIAHEVCHYQHRHAQKTIGLQLLSLGGFLFLFSLVAYRPSFYASFGFKSVDIGVGLCLFSYLYSPIAAWLSMIGNYVSRSWEFECDLYAQKHNANIREALISMCDLNGGVDSICGNGMWSVYNRGHPSLLERVQWLDKNK